MKLTDCLHQFFDEYLPRIKGASVDTIKTYRDALSLLLQFASRYHSMDIKKLDLEHITGSLIFDFLDHLENNRENTTRTRNLRLAAIKSLAKMIRLLYPEYRVTAETMLNIPQKRCRKKLIGYLHHDDVLKVFNAVDMKRAEGFRDYAILHLLYDSGARAGEIGRLKLEYLDSEKYTLAIVGKGNRYRLIQLWPKTVDLLDRYIQKQRLAPKPLYRNHLFINQRREAFTRHGIYRICRKYLTKSLSEKQRRNLNPAHSFRHSCAVNMLLSGCSLTEIKNHLGHENLNSTMIYLHLDLSRKKEVQQKFLEYTRSRLKHDDKIDELIDWENKAETLRWLDSL